MPADEGKEQYGFVTNKKMKLIFDDSNKRVTIVATTASGEEKSIVMNDDSNAFIMTDENQNTIKMDASGITIQAAKNVVIKGATVMIN